MQIRPSPEYRSAAFVEGLRKCGYEVLNSHKAHQSVPEKDDVLVIWNRYAHSDLAAKHFEKVEAKVLIAENGYLGREWLGNHWYAVSRNYHNGAGSWPIGGSARWASFQVPLSPWKTDGKEIVILDGRGIGPKEYAQPKGWANRIQIELKQAGWKKVRIRVHPGEKIAAVPLQDDLSNAYAAIAWGSGAALKALTWGIPVFYGLPQWIGASAAKHVSAGLQERFLGDRLPMFERLAWAMWSADELSSGEPFKCLLQ